MFAELYIVTISPTQERAAFDVIVCFSRAFWVSGLTYCLNLAGRYSAYGLSPSRRYLTNSNFLFYDLYCYFILGTRSLSKSKFYSLNHLLHSSSSCARYLLVSFHLILSYHSSSVSFHCFHGLDMSSAYEDGDFMDMSGSNPFF